MAKIDQEVLDLLKGQDLSVKQIAEYLDRSPASLYKPLNSLVVKGLVRKGDKLVKGKAVSHYGVPEEVVEGCRWQAHKQILLASSSYKQVILENDYWDTLHRELEGLSLSDENRHIGVVGLVGWGKSCTAIYIAHLLDPSLSVEKGIIFEKEGLLRLVVDQPVNKSFVLDDVGVMLPARGWQEKTRQVIFSWFQICRANKINTVATTPSLSMVDVNYQRLLHYVLQVEFKCKDHIHLIVFKRVSAGLEVSLKPVGVITFPYPWEVDSLIREYQSIKQKRLTLSAKASLERFQNAKEGVRQYVQKKAITRITDFVIRSALESIGLGELPKGDKEKLGVYMYDVLEEKKAAQKRAKQRQVSQGKENLRQAKLEASYKKKYQNFIDQGRSIEFAQTLSCRLVYEKGRAGNINNLFGVLSSLFKKIDSDVLEKFVLDNLNDHYLVAGLRMIREVFSKFKGFDLVFYTKLFKMMLFGLEAATIFIKKSNSLKSGCRYHGKFSPKKWRQKVSEEMRSFEIRERKFYDLKYLFVDIVGALTKSDSSKRPKFWGDL